MKLVETVAEIKRTCVLVATTENNHLEYNEKMTESRIDYGYFEPIMKWQGCDIYKNNLHYLIVYHYKNVLELYKPIL